MTPLDDDREQQLADLLADYEAQMAAGGFDTPQGEVRSAVDTLEESHRLQSAKACLLRLERIWPHGRPLDDELPRTIDRFEVISELGRGGFGIVYLARDAKMGRLVALKVQRPETLLSASLRERFVREARAAARLSHQHIAGVYEVGEAGMRVWIASEYVADDSLSAWLRDNRDRVAPKAAARLVADLADALTCAHRLGVLHRDLKPSNVLLQRIANSGPEAADDDAARSATSRDPSTRADDLGAFAPKLIDFGLAKLDEGTRHETRTGALIGTPPYMAPEQAAGQTQAIGPATDVYGLGTILYELVTGRPPFRGENDVQTLRQVLDDDPPHPRKLRPEAPADLAAITLKCLEKQPAARYTSTAELAADLQRFRNDRPTMARPLSLPQRVAKWSRRRPAVAALVAVSVLAAVTFVAVNAAYIRQLRHSTKIADALRNEAEASAATANEQEDIAHRYLYASRMRLADELLRNGDGLLAAPLIESYLPPSTQSHRRGFEWYYLKSRLHPEQKSLAAHSGQAYGVAYSPDGRRLASGGEDKLVKIWDVASGRMLGELPGHKACVNCVAFSPDGQLLTSVGCDGLLKVWDALTHALIATLETCPGEIHSLAFSPNGLRLATGHKAFFGEELQGVTNVWDVATLEILATYKTQNLNVDYLAWLDDHTLIFADHPSNTVDPRQVLWNFETDHRKFVPYGGNSITLSRDRRDVAMGEGNGAIFSIPELSTVTVNSPGNFDRTASLSLSPSGKWLAASYFGSSIRLWSWPSMTCRQVWPGNGSRPQTVTFSPDGNQLASAHWDGTVRLWGLELDTLPKVQSTVLARKGFHVTSRLTATDDLRYFAIPTDHNEVSVYDVPTGRLLAKVVTDVYASALRFDKHDPEILYGLSATSGTFWRARWRTGDLETVGTVSPSSVEPHFIASDGNQVLIMAEEQNLHYRVARPNEKDSWWVSPYARPLVAFVSSSSGNTIAMTESRGPNEQKINRTEILDFAKHTVREIGDNKVDAVTDDGRWVALDNGATGLIICDTATLDQITAIKQESRRTAAAFSPDAKTLATSDVDNRIQLWNLPTGNLVGQLEASGWTIVRIWFAPNGRRLAAVGFKEAPPSKDFHQFHQIQLFVFSASDEP